MEVHDVLVFSHMLKSFDMEDLETLWKLVKAKHGSTRPKEGVGGGAGGCGEGLYESAMSNLKTMFDHYVEDQVWRNQHDYKVLDWKLYDSCGVHSLRKQNVHIHMLVEKRYPLTPATITDMLNRKLQADHWNEMIVGIKRLHDDLGVTAAKVCVTAAKLKNSRSIQVGSTSAMTSTTSSYILVRLPINREAITEVILYSASPPSPPYDFYDHHRSLLMLLVYKLLLLVFRVNAAGIKLQLLTELQMLMDKDCLCDMYEIFL
ncbi:hypothetical protein Tco_1180458 [Tanacetum coccineum]